MHPGRTITRIVLLSFAIAILNCLAAVASTPDERVLVVGSRARVTEIPYSKDLTVTKAIIAAGGYGDFSRTSIFLVRCSDVTQLDMRAILESGQRDKDVPLKPWDTIVIGTTLRASELTTPRK
jgi:protein involved in polysaccharide export with SLBB domain